MLIRNHKVGLYQTWLKKSFSSIEAAYYGHVDELIQKLGDMEIPELVVPDFTLSDYSFVVQWEIGNESSADVCDAFSKMDFNSAAKAKLTKRLINFMMDNDIIADYVKPVVASIDRDCTHLMVKHLGMMQNFFNKMSEIDKQQIPICWIEQKFEAGGMTSVHNEMPLNQAIKQIDTYIIKQAQQKLFMGDQIIILDENLGDSNRTLHWLFAPRSYTELLKVLFQIKEKCEGKAEEVYLKKLFEVYIK